ncbi:MAG: phosphatidylserine decarboxylase [Alphaproteobacteria bacterium]|nr:phosphatidylserine decarboxylase [Alphaproteobacteria bacterium]
MQSHKISIKNYLFPSIHKEGIKFVLIFATVTMLLWAIHPAAGWFGTVLTLGCFYFFRNPPRVTPEGDSLIISPADGIVQMIGSVTPPMELELGNKPLTRISVFMSVFNVHVNRAPAAGRVVKTIYHHGAFMNASLDKASEKNERQSVVVETKDGKTVGFVQIAGLIARRILCNLRFGTKVEAGEVFGLIRFGSRLDVYLPEGVEPKVICGQTAVAGETILADMAGTQVASKGEMKGEVAKPVEDTPSTAGEYIDERDFQKVSPAVVAAEKAKAKAEAKKAAEEMSKEIALDAESDADAGVDAGAEAEEKKADEVKPLEFEAEEKADESDSEDKK